jgi:hypothetical protein
VEVDDVGGARDRRALRGLEPKFDFRLRGKLERGSVAARYNSSWKA